MNGLVKIEVNCVMDKLNELHEIAKRHCYTEQNGTPTISLKGIQLMVEFLATPEVSGIVLAFKEWQKKYPLVNLEDAEWQIERFLSEYYR